MLCQIQFSKIGEDEWTAVCDELRQERIAGSADINLKVVAGCATWVPRKGSLRFCAFQIPSRHLSARPDGQKKKESETQIIGLHRSFKTVKSRESDAKEVHLFVCPTTTKLLGAGDGWSGW